MVNLFLLFNCSTDLAQICTASASVQICGSFWDTYYSFISCNQLDQKFSFPKSTSFEKSEKLSYTTTTCLLKKAAKKYIF